MRRRNDKKPDATWAEGIKEEINDDEL